MSETNKKKKRRKHRAVLPYITKPITYLLISLVLIIPIGLALLNYSVNLVHKAQPSFAFSISDIKLNDDAYKKSGVKSGTVKRPSPAAGDKIGELKCGDAGFFCNVYYGKNRISLKQGAGMKTEILPGDTGVCEMYGERANAFKAVKNLKVGDKLTLDTSWGSFVYSVSSVEKSTQPPDDTMPQSLLLVCAADDTVYSNLNDEKLYILADIESGPQLEEVQK